MTREEAEPLALYVQLPAPTPPQRPLADIRASWQLRTPVAARPTAPPAGRAHSRRPAHCRAGRRAVAGAGPVRATESR